MVTLGLPWQIGADFFPRHLLDGDAASNTLGWRWVAELYTQGKVYAARPKNIEQFSEGRFAPDPAELCQSASDRDPYTALGIPVTVTAG